MERIGMRVARIVSVMVFLLPCSIGMRSAAQTRNVCVECHATLQGRLQAVVDESTGSVHGHKGMSCETCHGGNSQDAAHAKSPGSGFRGQIKREDIPELCGSCHANTERIKQFNPSLRTDQLSQYHTSVHGMKLAKGDVNVAVCTDCHGVHNIRPASDPTSPVNALNVAATCSRCHSNVALMKSYRIAATQYADYSDSVHHEAMMVRGDLSAPTCSSCHGSHGAVPPGAASVANVCGTCHVLQAQFFDESPHKAAFPEGCATCHSAHKIKRPDDNFVGLAAGAACADCHSAEEESGKTAVAIHEHLKSFETSVNQATLLIDRAARSGMDVADAQMEISQAMDALTKARVRVHSAQLAKLDSELTAGSRVLARARSEGDAAIRERNSRRKGLLVPVIVIAAMVFSLGAYIRELERNSDS
jgi:cytochrome c3-like protein